MQPLVRTPLPYSDESMRGYILRVSEANGYDSPGYVISQAGMTPVCMSSSHIDLNKLSAILCCEPKDLIRIANRTRSNHIRSVCILKNVVNASFFRVSNLQLCPECVKERGYIEAHWDINLIVACPRHRRFLLNECPECNQTLSWRRPGQLTCRCGAIFTATRPLPLPSDELLQLTRAIINTARGISNYGILLKSILRQRRYMNLNELLTLIQTEGKSSLALRGISRSVNLSAIVSGAVHSLVVVGAGTISPKLPIFNCPISNS